MPSRAYHRGALRYSFQHTCPKSLGFCYEVIPCWQAFVRNSCFSKEGCVFAKNSHRVHHTATRRRLRSENLVSALQAPVFRALPQNSLEAVFLNLQGLKSWAARLASATHNNASNTILCSTPSIRQQSANVRLQVFLEIMVKRRTAVKGSR